MEDLDGQDGEWANQPSGTVKSLSAVHFVDATAGWVVGEDGIILNTVDGGATWTPQASGVVHWLKDVSFVDRERGWIVGGELGVPISEAGIILATTDGGATWVTQAQGVRSLMAVHFIDRQAGWAAGANGAILRTTDGGSTWSSQASGTTDSFRDVHFVDTLHGWAVSVQTYPNMGFPSIHRTSNGGTTWTSQTSPTSNLSSIHFPVLTTGWVVGGSGGGGIRRSTDAGETWSPQVPGTTEWLNSVTFVDGSTGWVVGSSGTVLVTNDAGENWAAQHAGTTRHLRSVSFPDRRNGWAVGDDGTIIRYREAAPTYVPVVPSRVLDTRDGTGGLSAPVGHRQTVTTTVAGRGGVPADATAVAINITAVTPTRDGYLTVWPAGKTRPTISSINFGAGSVVGNFVIAELGTDGNLAIYNHNGLTDVVFDVVGYLPAATDYTPVTPARVLDTRDTVHGDLSAPVGHRQTATTTVAGRGGIPADATAVAINITAVTPTRDGYLTVWPAGKTRPTISSINFGAGSVVGNFVIAELGTDGNLAIYNHNGLTDVVFDVVGYLPTSQRFELRRYASDTWHSLEAMVFSETGLPADSIRTDGLRAGHTSPTNIGVYLWSALAARDLGLITADEAHARLAATIGTLTELERHATSGQFFNWYDPATGEVLEVWPDDGAQIDPFLSAVDNGWLSAALLMVANAVPEMRSQALALHESMDLSFYYDPQIGLLRGGYWPFVPPSVRYAPTISAEPVIAPAEGDPAGGYTDYHNGTLNSETRIAGYLAMVAGSAPAEHYFRMLRTFPDDGCDWAWQEMRPVGASTPYLGVDVFAGAYPYRGMQIVPSWGGSMFEALMVNLIVPEAAWGPDSWGVNHPLYVQAHIEHGLEEAGYGYWGFSPARIPEGGYLEYGVEALGLNPRGYPSTTDRTDAEHGNVNYGYEGCRDPEPLPEEWPNGVVTPHAVFLALEFAPAAALENLAALRTDFDGIYTTWGFRDSVNVQTGTISDHYLALDQGMIMAAIANASFGEMFRDYFAQGAVEQALRPLLELEEFNAAPAP